MQNSAKIGVIGGSGLYNMPEIKHITAVEVDTPFGKPSDLIRIGQLRGKQVAFLPRHGVGHVISPSSIPQLANIYALKSLGVRFIISANACGSLQEEIAPGHLIVPDQIIDYTIGTRDRSFFQDDVVAHVSVADPFDEYIRQQLIKALEEDGATHHQSGTFLIEDGPRFATRAESHLFRQWGCDIIGMTSAPEAFLAREAEIGYATIGHVTDYDSWREETEPVTSNMVVTTMKQTTEIVKRIIARTVELVDEDHITPSHHALDTAITTDRTKIPPESLNRLKAILSRVMNLTD